MPIISPQPFSHRSTLLCLANNSATFLSCTKLSLSMEGDGRMWEKTSLFLFHCVLSFSSKAPHSWCLPSVFHSMAFQKVCSGCTSTDFSAISGTRAFSSKTCILPPVDKGLSLLGSFLTWVLCLSRRGNGWCPCQWFLCCFDCSLPLEASLCYSHPLLYLIILCIKTFLSHSMHCFYLLNRPFLTQ